MPVDPQIQALLDRAAGVPPTHTLPVAVARAQYEARAVLLARPAEIAGVRERTIILNLPGSPDGALQSLGAVIETLSHAIELLAGKTDHPA